MSCRSRAEDHQAAFKAAVQALQAITAKHQMKLEEAFGSPSNIDREEFADLKTRLETMSRHLIYRADEVSALYTAIPRDLISSGMRNAVVAGLADKLLSAVNTEQNMTREVAEALYAMGENALESCDWSRMPVRKAR